MPAHNVLIIEDDVLVGDHLRMGVEALDCTVGGVVGNYAEGLRIAEAQRPELVLININIGGVGRGIDAAERIQRQTGAGIVLLLSQVDDELMRRVANLKPLGMLMKPFQNDEMKATVRAAVAKARADSEAADQERRQTAILDAISDGHWDYDISANKFVFSSKWVAGTGYDQSKLICASTGFASMVHADDMATLLKVRQQLCEQRAEIDVKLRFVHADGVWHWYRGRGRAIEFDHDGLATRAVGVVEDITENVHNKRMVEKISAQQALAVSEKKYEELINSVREGILIVQDSKIRFANAVASVLAGSGEDGLVGRPFLDIFTQEDRHLMGGVQYSALSNRRKSMPVKLRMAGKSNLRTWIQCQISPTQWEGEPALLACMTDITDSVRARASLEQYTETLQALIDCSPLAVVVLDHRRRVVHWGGAAQEMFGWSEREVLGSPTPLVTDENSFLLEGYLKSLDENPGSGNKLTVEVTRLHKEGSEVEVSLHMSPIISREGDVRGVLCLYEDITERKREQRRMSRMEARLAKIRRLEAVSQLARGVAHEFNNILASVTGYNELALEDMEEGDNAQATEHLERSNEAAMRGRDVVRRLMPISRQADGQRRPVDMSVALHDLLRLVRPVLPKEVKLVSDISTESAVVQVDTTQIQQVLINLCNNTWEALDGQPGCITISTSIVDVSEYGLSGMPSLEAGRHLRLSFRDDGPGMSDDVIQRAFEPFYSAKNDIAKRGLGLTEVHGIIAAHQGVVEIHSNGNSGTEVVVMLPLWEGEADETSSIKQRAADDVARILFVDDEAPLVEIFRRTLSRMGHSVEAFDDSRLAMEAFRSNPEGFDLIITDQSMPYLTGLELAQAVRQTRKDIPVIICTGFSEQLTSENRAQAGVDQVLMKPVDRQTIAQAIDQALSDQN